MDLIQLLSSNPTSSQSINPDDYAGFANEASTIVSIREAYNHALADQEDLEQETEIKFINAAKEYLVLHENIESSSTLLTSLEAFLSTFQHDLSAVSGHISDLQSRSRLIEAKLHGRKTLESTLGQTLSRLIIPRELIDLIVDTEPNDAWLIGIIELESRLTAIRGGPRVASRQNLDTVAEKLRIKAADKLRRFFIDLLVPYRTSISRNIQILQTDTFLKYRIFYAFLQRHATRQAHEVQKAYIAAASWYYETAFRRYTRALEKVRVRSTGRDDSLTGTRVGEGSLTAMLLRDMSSSALKDPLASNDSQVNEYSRIDGPPILSADMADYRDLIVSTEALFRSVSVALTDNAASEYAFISDFFGKPSDIPSITDSFSPKASLKGSWDVLSANESFNISSPVSGSVNNDDFSIDDSASMVTTSEVPSGIGKLREAGRKTKNLSAESVWKQVMTPVLDYCKNFVNSLLEPAPSPLSTLSMIRLNDAIYQSLILDEECPVSEMESHLIGLKLQLWPIFQKEMSSQLDSVKKLAASASGTAGLFGGKSAGIKEAVIQNVIKRYISLFVGVVQLCSEEDEGMVFSSISRLRNELQKLLEAQAARMSDKTQTSAYLSRQYEDLLSGMSNGFSSHPRSQAEIAHWREMARKA